MSHAMFFIISVQTEIQIKDCYMKTEKQMYSW